MMRGFLLPCVFSWNAAFANTHSGLGGTQQIFLVTAAMLLKAPPPTPAQLFRVIPERGHVLLKLYPVVFVVAHTACPHDRTGASNNRNELSVI